MHDETEDWLKSRVKEPLITGGELLPGTLVGACKIVAMLGRGGFAEVYKATAPDGRAVAVKMLHRLDEKSRARFEMESRILLGIRHPNLPRAFSFGSCGERPYMVMELLGTYELPRRDRPVASFLGKIVSAIQALHAHGYLHRDIKPQNLLMREDGEPVVVDFGLACPISKVERSRKAISVDGQNRVAVGTPGYSAPEQFTGQDAGVEADVHAIGVLIRACFGEKMPKCWNDISMKATNSDPEVRYRTVEGLGKAIRRRHWKRIAVLFSAFVAVVLLIALAWPHVAEKVEDGRTPGIVPRDSRY